MTVNVVPIEVRVRHWRPDQIDEWLLPRPGKHRLQPCGHGGREDIVGKDLQFGRVLALNFNCGLSRGLDRAYHHPSVEVCFLPLESLVEERSNDLVLFLRLTRPRAGRLARQWHEPARGLNALSGVNFGDSSRTCARFRTPVDAEQISYARSSA